MSSGRAWRPPLHTARKRFLRAYQVPHSAKRSSSATRWQNTAHICRRPRPSSVRPTRRGWSSASRPSKTSTAATAAGSPSSTSAASVTARRSSCWRQPLPHHARPARSASQLCFDARSCRIHSQRAARTGSIAHDVSSAPDHPLLGVLRHPHAPSHVSALTATLARRHRCRRSEAGALRLSACSWAFCGRRRARRLARASRAECPSASSFRRHRFCYPHPDPDPVALGPVPAILSPPLPPLPVTAAPHRPPAP